LLGVVAGSSRDQGPRHSLVEYLFEKGVDPNQMMEMYGRDALSAAAGWPDTRMLCILLDGGATLNGSCVLQYAAGRGKTEHVVYLLVRGANVNEVVEAARGSEANYTALHATVEYGHVEIVDVLLDAGADVELKDAQERTVAEITRAKGMDEAMLVKLLWRGVVAECNLRFPYVGNRIQIKRSYLPAC
jgi:uncharacterized protein